MSLVPGDRIGPYAIVELLGAGGMGEVYRARDPKLGRAVALKVWHRPEADAEAAGRRLLREARAASALNHPNIVVVHDFGTTEDGRPYLVQEFIDGRTLRSHLTEPSSGPALAALMAQVARALAAAHAAGVVHRDIKPDNIMVRADGYVKVLDFGIARQVADAGTDDTTRSAELTQSGDHSLTGTPAYLAPELILSGTVAAPGDVFALGVVMYEAVTGRRPFIAATSAGMLAAITSEAPVPLRRLAPDAPAELEDLVLAMLEKSPVSRPTAEAVAAALTRLAEGPRPRRQTRSDTTVVGRAEPLARLHDSWTRAREGRGRLIGIAGEPGIGKTNLLNSFLERVADEPEAAIVARGRCTENLAGQEAYLPVLDALDHLRSTTEGTSLASLMRTVAPTWFGQIVSLTATSDAKASHPAPSQERMKRELEALVHDLSRRAPMVWIIDDLHWADVSTIDLLNYLAGRLEGLRILIVLGFRPSDMALTRHPFLTIRTDLQSRGVYEELALSFLDRHDVAEYVAGQFPQHRFPDGFVDDIFTRTGGSPLFMVDLVRYLRDTAAVVQVDGVWQVSPAGKATGADLPASVKGLIARKLERVDEHLRAMLVCASVQGQEFDSTVLAEALEVDPADVEERLEQLESTHLLVRKVEENEFPDRVITLRYRFAHVLYQNVLYASLQPTRRATLAGKTARALAAHAGSDPTAAARLAVLFEAARDFASAAKYFLAAAKRATSMFGYREALSLIDRGLDGLRGVPDGPDRLRLELALQMTRALAQRSVKGYASQDLEATLARARQICLALKDPPALFPVLWNITFFNLMRGNLDMVRAELPNLLTQADASGNAAFVMAANHAAGVAYEFLGDVAESSAALERARGLHDPSQHLTYTAMFGMDPGIGARAMSARPLWALGYPDQAIARAHEAATVALGRSRRHPVTVVFALMVGIGLHVNRGEAAEALALGDEVLELCREYEFPQEAEWARAFQAGALIQLGRVDEGIAQTRASLDALAALRSGLVRTTFLAQLASAYVSSHRIDEGLAVVHEGFTLAASTGEHGFLHELHRLRGLLLWRDGRIEDAERDLRVALDEAARRSAKSFELRAATALAGLLADTGRAGDGAAILRPVYDWFTEGHATADLRAARAVLGDDR